MDKWEHFGIHALGVNQMAKDPAASAGYAPKEAQMETVKAIEIPASHVAFANAVAELAEKNGIAEFTLEYEPHWREEKGERWDHRVRGKARINYRAKDGRGRPCRNLSISLDAAITHVIESNPESF